MGYPPDGLLLLSEFQSSSDLPSACLSSAAECLPHQVQQALKADPLRRWRRVGDYAAREHAKQDRITRMVADDRCAARDWLEVRASFRFGMFSSSSMSSV